MAERGRGRTLALAALAAAVAIPAVALAAPESILPKGFGTPAPPPPPPATPRPSATPAPRPSTAPPASPRPSDPAPPPAQSTSESPPPPPPTRSPPPPRVVPTPPPPVDDDVPDTSSALDRVIVYSRPLDDVGVLGFEDGGIAPDGFGGADGRFLTALLNATRAPLVSRWQQITARRVLLSRVPTPSGVLPADWIAARALFLARSGEADPARWLVSAVDPDRLTPAFSQAAMLTALANADASGLCPYAPFVEGSTPLWRMAQAVCAGLSGEPGRAVALVEQARRAAGGRRTPDILLAEKVIGATANGRRAVRMRWEEVPQLTPWRFGMAAATGAVVPTALWDDAAPEIRAWGARAPLYSSIERAGLAATAALLGAFSSANYVTALSAAAATGDTLPDTLLNEVNNLREAYVADDAAARIAAMKSLWGTREDAPGYAALVLTARAAARVVPSDKALGAVDRLVASMFTAGLDRSASRWAALVEDDGSKSTDLAWALLAVGSPDAVVSRSRGRVESFVERQDKHRAALLVAALAGLGRLDAGAANTVAGDLNAPLDVPSRWSNLLASAAARNQPGTVVLIASAGLQSADWSDLPPHHLYQILAAYRQVGLEGPARMIAAEALTRA